MSAPPTPPTDHVWLRGGARTVTQAMAESGLSRDELFELMNSGVVRWFPHGGRGAHRRRLLAWADVADYLDGLHRGHLETAGADARTPA